MAVVMTMAAHVVAALMHMHKANVLHRDLALRNLILCRTGKLVVADFGLSRLLEEGGTHHSATRTGLFPTASPPEVVLNLCFRKASDVYMFGLVLWGLWTLNDPNFRPLHQVKDWVRVGQHICEGKVADSLRFKDAKCPPDVRTLITGCLAMACADRPSLSDVAEELQRIRARLSVRREEAHELLRAALAQYQVHMAQKEMNTNFNSSSGTVEYSFLNLAVTNEISIDQKLVEHNI
jgi:serine/threonine protein kinase